MLWATPDSPDYDQKRALFNATIDKRPRIIAGYRNIRPLAASA